MKISKILNKAKALTNRLFENNSPEHKLNSEAEANITTKTTEAEAKSVSTLKSKLASKLTNSSATAPVQQRSLEVLAKLRERLDSHLNLDEEVHDIFFDDDYEFGKEEHDKVLNSLHDKSGKNLAPSLRGQEVTDSEVKELSLPTSTQNRYALAQIEQAAKEQGQQVVALLDKDIEHTIGESAREAAKATYALSQLAKKAEKDEHSETEITTSVADNPSNAKIKSYTYKASTSRTVVQVTNDDGSVTHSVVEKTELVNEETHSTAGGKLETNKKVSRDVKTSTHQLNDKQVAALQTILTAGEPEKFLLAAGTSSELEAESNAKAIQAEINAHGQRLLQPLAAPEVITESNTETSLTPPSKGKKIKGYQYGKNKKVEESSVTSLQSSAEAVIEVEELNSASSKTAETKQEFSELLNSSVVSSPSFAELEAEKQEVEDTSVTSHHSTVSREFSSQASQAKPQVAPKKKKIKGYQYGVSKQAQQINRESEQPAVVKADSEPLLHASNTSNGTESNFSDLLDKAKVDNFHATVEAEVADTAVQTTSEAVSAKLSFEELYDNPSLAEPQSPSFADLLAGNKSSATAVTREASSQASATTFSAAQVAEKVPPRQTPPSKGKKIKGYKEKKNQQLEVTTSQNSFAAMFTGEGDRSEVAVTSSTSSLADLPEVITGKDINQQATSSFMAQMMSGVRPLAGNEVGATLAQAAKRSEEKKRIEQKILSRKELMELEDREKMVDKRLREFGFISDINQKFTLEQIESGAAVFLAEGVDKEYLNYIQGEQVDFDEIVDLHAMTKEEAKKAIQQEIAYFMRDATVGVVLFLTGHGTNELKANVPNYLIQLYPVIAMTTNREQYGAQRRVNGVRVVLRNILR